MKTHQPLDLALSAFYCKPLLSIGVVFGAIVWSGLVYAHGQKALSARSLYPGWDLAVKLESSEPADLDKTLSDQSDVWKGQTTVGYSVGFAPQFPCVVLTDHLKMFLAATLNVTAGCVLPVPGFLPGRWMARVGVDVGWEPAGLWNVSWAGRWEILSVFNPVDDWSFGFLWPQTFAPVGFVDVGPVAEEGFIPTFVYGAQRWLYAVDAAKRAFIFYQPPGGSWGVSAQYFLTQWEGLSVQSWALDVRKKSRAWHYGVGIGFFQLVFGPVQIQGFYPQVFLSYCW